MLHACALRNTNTNSSVGDFEKSSSFRLDECNFDQISRESKELAKSSKKSLTSKNVIDEPKFGFPALHLMNTLTPRMERTIFPSKGSINDAAQSLVHSEAVLTKNSTLERNNGKRKGRKRKLTASEGSKIPDKDTTINTDALCEREDPSNFGVYVIASNLNGIVSPSEARPVVMHLTSSSQSLLSSFNHQNSECDKTNKSFLSRKSKTTKNSTDLIVQAWSEIPGLERVTCPITSICFSSRSRCGPEAWSKIISAVDEAKRRSGESPPCESFSEPVISEIFAENGLNAITQEGVILIGFKDGSLMASFVSNNYSPSKEPILVKHDDHDLVITSVVTILRMPGNEPIISIQLISLEIDETQEGSQLSQKPCIILCAGALGTIVTLPSSNYLRSSLKLAEEIEIAHRLIPCKSRLVSIGCLAVHFPDNKVEHTGVISKGSSSKTVQSPLISLIATDDLGRTTQHSFPIYCGKPLQETPVKSLRLPRFSRFSSSIAPLPSGVSAKSVFVLLARKNKIAVLAIPSSITTFKDDETQGIYDHDTDAFDGRWHGVGLIHVLLPKLSIISSMNDEKKTIAIQNHSSENKASKLREILDKIESFNTNEKEKFPPVDETNSRSNLAMREIRDTIKAVSFLSDGVFATATIQDNTPITDHLQRNRLRFDFNIEDFQFINQGKNSYHLSLHLLQSRSTSLSDFLRPESARCTHPICYRSTLRHDRVFTKVLYGGTSTSVSETIRIYEDRTPSNPLTLDFSVYDLLPLICFASFGTIYIHANSKDHNWCQSYKLKGDVGLGAVSSVCAEVKAKRLHYCGSTYCNGEQILGVALPFHVVTHDNPEIPLIHDILSISKELSVPVQNQFGDSSARTSAERSVYHYYKSHRDQSNSSENFVLPVFNEERLIKQHSHPSGRGRIEEKESTYCCSNSLQVLNFQQFGKMTSEGHESSERLVNLGNGSLVLTFAPSRNSAQVGEFGFAVASSFSTPNETLALLPLVRQCFIHRILQLTIDERMPRGGHDEMKLLGLYHNLLSKKQTMNVAKHVAKASGELHSTSDFSKTGSCDDSSLDFLLARSLSLYETLRSLRVVLN